MNKQNSKRVFMKLFLFALIILSFGAAKVNACEIFFEVIKNEKEKYNINDTIVIKVNVIFTHRICPAGIEKTEFETNGLNIITTNDWIEIDTGMWEKEMKLVVTGTKSGDISITGIRRCEKEGGKGTVSFKSEQLEN